MKAVKPEKFIGMFNLYIKINQKNTDKAVAALYAEYEPLDNNAVITEITETTHSESTPSAVTSTVSERTFDDDSLRSTQKNEVSGTQSTGDGSRNYTEKKHGNISATTNQAIIEQETELRLKNYALALIERAVYFGGVFY